ncbi:MAG: DNRLRE domain-containing protein [Calditrichaceae bacterium]|nr:DNRLRE domain-containing protein [Calditrichaceae bacterium]
MKYNLSKRLIFLIFMIPYVVSAEVITIEDVDVKGQPKKNGEYQLLINFELPELPENINIDYAGMTMGVNVVSNPDTLTMNFEILTDINSKKEKLVNYNSNPVTTLISRKQKGLTKLELDITQIVKLWVNEGESNSGITLVSHRNVDKKFLKSERVIFAPGFTKPTVRIFFTIIDS